MESDIRIIDESVWLSIEEESIWIQLIDVSEDVYIDEVQET